MAQPERVLVVAPHPDDETLGCGGTLLRHVARGDEVHWLVATRMTESSGYTAGDIAERQAQIGTVSAAYGFASVVQLDFPTTELDSTPLSRVVGAVAGAVQEIRPQRIYLPYRNDAHSDHEVVFDAIAAATKVFRAPFVRMMLAYEALSETHVGLKPEDPGFRPSVFVDVSDHLSRKVEILGTYATELAPFPFPRSREAVEALAAFRGTQAGVAAAEAFMLLRWIDG